MTGLEYLQRVVDGRVEHPSMAHTLGFRLTEIEDGRAVITGETSEAYCNPNGSIHGGWPAALLDSCMGSSVHSTLPESTGFTVVEFKIDFLRPVTVERHLVESFRECDAVTDRPSVVFAPLR